MICEGCRVRGFIEPGRPTPFSRRNMVRKNPATTMATFAELKLSYIGRTIINGPHVVICREMELEKNLQQGECTLICHVSNRRPFFKSSRRASETMWKPVGNLEVFSREQDVSQQVRTTLQNMLQATSDIDQSFSEIGEELEKCKESVVLKNKMLEEEKESVSRKLLLLRWRCSMPVVQSE